jgi:exopolysaccharide biosynthesis WecB/TagA/CpsF family protein
MTIEKPGTVTRGLPRPVTATVLTGPHTPTTTRVGGLLAALAQLDIAGCPVHVVDQDGALRIIAASARRPQQPPLAVASINLDHVHHFGGGRRTLGAAGVQWLHLIDGAPIAQQVQRIVGTPVPRLAGSDLIPHILDDADRRGLTVAVLGGTPDVTGPLQERMAADWPGVRFAGHWTPPREVLDDPAGSEAIAMEIRASGVDILLVCLGKPRQEEWIDTYGPATGVGALLAFGAVVDFLAGRVSRAPRWVAAAGFEWMWRLVLEPRRLARRYLVEGPPAYLAVRRSRFPTRA